MPHCLFCHLKLSCGHNWVRANILGTIHPHCILLILVGADRPEDEEGALGDRDDFTDTQLYRWHLTSSWHIAQQMQRQQPHSVSTLTTRWFSRENSSGYAAVYENTGWVLWRVSSSHWRRLKFRIFTGLFSEMLPVPHTRSEREVGDTEGNDSGMLGTGRTCHARTLVTSESVRPAC